MESIKIKHPALGLKQEWLDLIRSKAAESESIGVLHQDILQLIYAEQWFNLLVPYEYGGMSHTLPEVVRLEESLAWADGSLGWTVTLCAGASWFAGFLEPAVAEMIFADKKACLSGSGAASGTAEVIPEGYRLHGRWKYATGIPHATWITANCVITENGKNCLDAEGNPVIKSFIVDAASVNIISDWNTVGLKATASQSFEIHNLIVNESQCFEINPARSRFDEPVFRYPFLQLAEVTLAANSSGMAVNFIDLAEGVFAERAARKKLKPEEAAVLTQAVSHAKNRMNTARADFYTALDRSWNILAAENAISAQVLNTVSRTSRELALTARQCVDELYPFCGLAAAVPQSDLNRVWRDIHTASQHSLLTFTKENS